MKRVRFHLHHPVDPGRIDVIEVEDGAVLVDSQAAKKYTPLVTVSALVAVEFFDDDATPGSHLRTTIDPEYGGYV